MSIFAETFAMSCTIYWANPIPVSAENLIIGTYEANKDILVVFTSATGRADAYPVTTDSEGVITLENPAPDLRVDTPYTITITEADDETQEAKSITIDDTDTTAITVEFKDIEGFEPVNFKISIV
ncbi:MAG TPA: hypothetical protein VG603_15210 [Chitinophagales bacterium]|nr:hypothetical protein [Chitinophagales bacterium]